MRPLPTGAEAVVFDCDGLLVDTEACATVAETAIFAAHGHPFGPEQKALVIGRTVEAAGEAMAQYFGRPDAGAEIAADLLQRVRKELSRGAAALPGAVDLVRACRAAVPVAVASNSPRELLDAALWSAGLADCFTHSFAADEVRSPSPHRSSTSRRAQPSVRPRSIPSPSRTRPRASPRHVLPGSMSRPYPPFREPASTTTGWATAWPTPHCRTGPGAGPGNRGVTLLRPPAPSHRRRPQPLRPHGAVRAEAAAGGQDDHRGHGRQGVGGRDERQGALGGFVGAVEEVRHGQQDDRPHGDVQLQRGERQERAAHFPAPS